MLPQKKVKPGRRKAAINHRGAHYVAFTNRLADKLKCLQEQKRRIEADAIMDAYLKSGNSYDEIMTFLNP